MGPGECQRITSLKLQVAASEQGTQPLNPSLERSQPRLIVMVQGAERRFGSAADRNR